MRLKKLLLCLSVLAGGASLPAAEPAPIAIDVTRQRDVISPLIYGQFIEHLGRCIYGGIWAEMLEDRKFYFEVSDTYAPYKAMLDTPYPVVGASPWQVVGPAGSVVMIKEKPFVGEQTPRLASGTAIRQNDLELVAQKSYVGYVWARSAGSAPAELEVSLSQAGSGVKFRVAPGDYVKHVFTFTATASGKASLTLAASGQAVDIGTASLMPSDNIRGMRKDTLAMLKTLNSPIYRWPGGNFVSGYDWRDGIGDRDRRPPRGNPAWTGVEHNDFGTDEFLDFCREIGTEPMVAVNTGFGDDYSAAQWVEYLNGTAQTIGGGWRVKNGHSSPYGVRYFCVGNEMFGPWQLGFMQLSHYVQKHNRTAKAMRKVDPNIILSGVGDIKQINDKNDPEQAKRGISWSEGMLESSADYMELLSEHFYEGRLPWTTEGRAELSDHVERLKKSIRERADLHRALQKRLPNLKGRIVPVAMDEWNYWHRDVVYGELGCIYDIADGLGVAKGLHEFFRQTDIIHLATYAQTVNVIGAIKTSRTAAELETTGLVLTLYRREFGQTPLEVADVVNGTDVAAALTADGKALTVGLVNPTLKAKTFSLQVKGANLAASGRGWVIAGSDEKAHNTPGQPRVVDIVDVAKVDPAAVEVPALGVLVVKIPLR